MFGGASSGVAARSLAVLLVLMPFILVGPVTAFAQYQMSLGAADAVPPLYQTTALEPFGLDTVPITSGEVVRKWSNVVADIRAETDILARCRDDAESCPPAAQKFLAVIAEGRAHEGRARYGVINRAINLAIQPISDLSQWGVPDRWSAPLATLTTARGDCEDYAIAKYVALREAGVSEEDLRLLIVRDITIGEDHAIVAARIQEKWIVLDNRRFVLLEDIEMPYLLPLFVLNEKNGVKQFAPMIAHSIISVVGSVRQRLSLLP
jgi:predicted transglutaminase-like cysteine proteinase